MKFSTDRVVKDNIITTTIKFEEYGTASLLAAQEKEMMENYPVSLVYSSIDFKSKFDVSNGEVIHDEVSGVDEVSIMLTNKEIPLDENFEVTYRVDIRNIKSAEIGTKLTSKELVAQAKCLLFEEKIKEKISELISDTRSKTNSFERKIEDII